MKTSVIAFPRVGAERELKFAAEKYFNAELSEEALRESAARIRAGQWRKMKSEGIDFIPSNDFSFYDRILDTALLFNLIPSRYRELNLSPLDCSFAMARGRGGAAGNVKPLAMKKWFNTNYHYIVPELEDDAEIRLSGEKPFLEFSEARSLGIETKPVLIGAFSFLKLLRFTGQKGIAEIRGSLVKAYRDYIRRFRELGAKWLQFDEPCLVRDLTEEDIALFFSVYEELLSEKGGPRILLQTYFGDLRDIYERLPELPFDGIGLDFVEGERTEALVFEHAFPGDRLLFAGLINGKNIWRNQYEKSLSLLLLLRERGIETVLSGSCSFLHLPYTLRGEERLSEDYKKHFAFAEEKLSELRELSQLAEGEPGSQEALRQNRALFSGGEGKADREVRRRCAGIRPEDYVRKPDFSEREKLQKAEFGLPLFPTTTIGSFPQTEELREMRRRRRSGELSPEEYESFLRQRIAEWIQIQEELGLDLLVHGEFERNDMVEYFAERLRGFLFTEKAWVQSYGTRCVKPPIIWGDVSRVSPLSVKWSVYAQSLCRKPVKGMLTGPVTILNWSFPREDISLAESAKQIALAIRDEVLELEKNGIRVIQVDEAALREKLPLRKSDWYSAYLDWAIPVFRLVHSGVRAETQIHTHMCYSEFGDIIPAIDSMDADVISFEASRSDLQILDSLRENHFRTEVGPGVYDIHSPRIPESAEIRAALEKMLTRLDKEKLWVNPDCGLKTRRAEEAIPSLRNMVKAARELREERGTAVPVPDFSAPQST